MTTPTVRRCGDTVPTALCGNLRPVGCTLEIGATGRHDGDHKAHLTIQNVGKVIFRWKNSALAPQPPVIDLPLSINTAAIAARVRREIVCECPEWWVGMGQKMHHSPCRKL